MPLDIPKWDDIRSSPQFLALPDPVREQIRGAYFQDFVEPTLAPDQITSALGEWDSLTKPAPQPPPRSTIGEITNQAVASARVELPKMIGQAMQYISEPGESVYEAGKSVRAFGEDAAAGYEPQPGQHGLITNTLASGARMLAPSLGVGVATAAALSPLGLAVGGEFAIPALLTGAAFGASQAQDTLEKGLKAGLSDELARETARKTGLIEAGGEALGTYFGYKLFGLAGKALFGEKTVQGAITSAVETGAWKPFLKQLPVTTAVEAGTEYGQNYGETAVEQAAGIPQDQTPHEAGVQGFAAALGMTALLAPFGLAGFVSVARNNAKVANALQNPEADPVQRAAASTIVYDRIKDVDEGAANSWMANSAFAINNHLPILLDESAAQPSSALDRTISPPSLGDAGEPTPTTETLVRNIANPDVGLDEFIADTARATGTLNTGGLIGSDVARAIAENAAVLPNQELRDFAISEQRDKQAMLAEQQAGISPAQIEDRKAADLAKPTPPRDPTAIELAMQAAQARAQQVEQAAAEREDAAQQSAQQEAARAAQQAKLPQLDELPILDRVIKRQPVADEDLSKVAEKGFVRVRDDGRASITEAGYRARQFLLRQEAQNAKAVRSDQEQTGQGGEAGQQGVRPGAVPSGSDLQFQASRPTDVGGAPGRSTASGTDRSQVSPLAPKTVAGEPVATKTDEQLRELATSPETPAITRHAAVTALQARASDKSPAPVANAPETRQNSLGEAQPAPVTQPTPKPVAPQEVPKAQPAPAISGTIQPADQESGQSRNDATTIATKPAQETGQKEPWQMTRREFEQKGMGSVSQETLNRAQELNRAVDTAAKEMLDVSGFWKRNKPGDLATRRSTIGALHEFEAHTVETALKSSKVPRTLKAVYLKAKAERDALSQQADIEASHETVIRNALAEGKPVPQNVLADYPDLVSRETTTVERPTGKILGKDVRDISDANIAKFAASRNKRVSDLAKADQAWRAAQVKPAAPVAEAAHVEDGKIEEVTGEVIRESVAKGADESKLTLPQQREFMLAELDNAIAKAKTMDEAGLKISKRSGRLIPQNEYASLDIIEKSGLPIRRQGENAGGIDFSKAPGIGYITIDVPGDGKFRIVNIKERLQALRGQASAAFRQLPLEAKRGPAEYTKTPKGNPTELARLQIENAKEFPAAKKPAISENEPIVGETRLLQTPAGEPIASIKLLTHQGRGMGTYEILEWLGGQEKMPVTGETYRAYFEGRADKKLISAVTRQTTREGAPLGYLQLSSGDTKYLGPAIQPTPEARSAAPVAESQAQPAKGEGEQRAESATEFQRTRPEELDQGRAQAAHAGTSMVPEKRAQAVQQEFADDVNGLYDGLLPNAKTDAQKAVLRAEVGRYKQGYLAHMYALLGAQSRVMSTMITGPSNFPTARNQKRGNTADRRRSEFLEWRTKARQAVARAVSGSRSSEQVAEDSWLALKKDVDRNIAIVNGIDDGSQLYDRPAFTNSVAGKLKRMADNGEVDLVRRTLDYIRERQATMKKPFFAERNSVWALGERAQETAAQEKPSGVETIAEYEGASIVNNHDEQRVQISFDTIPGPDLRNSLKSAGWHWSPSNKVWQRQNTDAAIVSAKQIIGVAFEEKPVDNGIVSESRTIEPGSGLPAADIRAHIAGITEGLAVDVPVFDTVEAAREAGFNIADDAQGFAKGDKLGLIAGNIKTLLQAEVALFHELQHVGIQRLVSDPDKAQAFRNYNVALNRMVAANPGIRRKAMEWREKYGEDKRKQFEAVGVTGPELDLRIRLQSFDEAVAEMAGERRGKPITRLNKLMAALQRLLRALGFDRLADWAESHTDAEVLSLIRSATQAITAPSGQQRFAGVQFPRKILSDDADEIIPSFSRPDQTQTPELGDPNIMHSRAGSSQAPGLVEKMKQAIPQLTRDRIQEWVDVKLYNYQNMFNMLPKMQNRLHPGVLPENMDANLAVESYPKKVAAQIDDFHDDTVKPFVKLLHDNNLTIDQAQEYVNAKDAPDRNREMKARNPTEPELDAIKSDLASQRDALAGNENVKEYIAKRRELRQAQADVEDGIADDSLVTMTEAEIAALRKEKVVKEYSAAVDKLKALQSIKPFVGDNTALSGMSDARAAEVIAKVKQDGTVEALERVSAAVDAITAKTRQILVENGLAKPEEVAAWEAAYPHYVPRFRDEVAEGGFPHPTGQGLQVRGKESKRATGSTKEVTNILAHVMAAHEAAIIRSEKVKADRALYSLLQVHPDNDVAELDVAPKVRDVDAKTGLVISRVDPLYKNKPNVLTLKIAGDEHTITFNEDNPEALRLAAAMKNLSAQDIGEITAMVGKFTRFLAAMNTAANPVFGLRNIIRDTGTAFVNLSDTELEGNKKQVFADMPKAIRGMWDMIRGDMTSEWAQRAREFRDAGGITGFVQHYKDIGQRAETLEKQLADMKPGKVNFTKQTALSYWHLIQDANVAVENGIRLSAYVNARKIGMSQAKAISLSNNLTVNFNKRGIKGAELNAWYMFMNASIQGTARLVKAMGSRNVQKVIGYVILSAFLLDLLNRGLAGDGDDDGENDYDQLPDYTKANNFVFWFGRPITIPMPYGYNFFASIGRMIGEAMFRKNYNPAKSAVNLGNVFLDAFSPMGQNGSLLQFAAPTIADPFVQWAENKNFAGNPLRKEQLPFGPPKPEYQMGFKSTSAPAKALAEVLNNWTGGNEVRPGLINMNPAVFDFAVTSLLGGAGRTYLQAISLPVKVATGDEVQAREIPFVNVFASAKPEYQIEHKFFENIKAVQTVHEELKHYAGDPTQLQSIREDHAAEIKLIGSARTMQNVLERIRKQERLIEKNKPEGWRDREKALEEQKNRIMSRFNKRVVEARAQ